MATLTTLYLNFAVSFAGSGLFHFAALRAPGARFTLQKPPPFSMKNYWLNYTLISLLWLSGAAAHAQVRFAAYNHLAIESQPKLGDELPAYLGSGDSVRMTF